MGSFSIWHWVVVLAIFGGMALFASVMTFVFLRIAKSSEEKAKRQNAGHLGIRIAKSRSFPKPIKTVSPRTARNQANPKQPVANNSHLFRMWQAGQSEGNGT